MKKISGFLIIVILSLFTVVHADPIYLTSIPIRCKDVDEHLKSIPTPKGFKISVSDAHKLAMKASGIIKPCASKLEQVIYFDSRYYYFTNAILIPKGQPFSKIKFVKVDGLTGKAKSAF